MARKICLPVFRKTWIRFAFLLLISSVTVFADSYSNQGTVYITGSISAIQDPQICNEYGCHIGSSWSLSMTFLAPRWTAPDSTYFISTDYLGCIGGPPCITDYSASSDFGWGPYGFDILGIDIENGHVVDARVGSGGYFIELGKANSWDYRDGFSGTTAGFATPSPDPATILTLVTGITMIGMVQRIPRLRG